MSPSLNKRIGRFYDRSSALWTRVWGEHMHHGYYAEGEEGPGIDHQRAQVRMIEELASWAEIGHPKRVLDAGCGVGGSARYLARKYGARVTGVTLSEKQARMGERLNRETGLEERVRMVQGDLLQKPEGESFDLIWSLESAEHIGDKRGMLTRFHRLLEPNGKLALATWCHRPLPPALTGRERRLLGTICKAYFLPPFVPLSELEQNARIAGFKGVEGEDWSPRVVPFWSAVIRSAVSIKALRGLAGSGLGTIRAAFAMKHMRKGLESGLVRYVVLKGVRE